MLTVHHLQRSQSERIVWLCEELGVPYELKLYQRDSKTFMAPPEYQALHPSKSAPIIQDGDVTLAESGAIVEYILAKYGNGKLAVPPSAANYADYLYFLHFPNGTFQPGLLRARLVQAAGMDPESPGARFSVISQTKSLALLEERLRKNSFLAGEEFTAADIMLVFSLTTMRLYHQYSLEGFEGILAYLKRISERVAYKTAMEKGDPGFERPFGAEPKAG